MSRWNRTLHTALGIFSAAAVGIVAAPAGAVPTWSPPRGLSVAQTDVVHNAVAADRAGNTLVAWRDGEARIQAIYRQAGQSYGTPRQLSEAGSSAPAMAMTEGGDAFATSCQGGQVRLATRAIGRLFKTDSPPLGGCTGAGPAAGGPPVLATGPNRSALVAWLDNDGTCNRVYFREVRVDGAGYAPVGPTTPTPVSECPDDASEPRIAQNARGDAAIAFRQGGLIALATRQSSGSFGLAGVVAAAGNLTDRPAVAVARDGNVAAVWRRSDPLQVEGTGGAAGTLLAPGVALSTAGGGSLGPPDVVFDEARAATAAWVDDLGGTQLRTATKAPGSAAFAGPQPVAGGSDALVDDEGGLDLAASPAGSLIVIFQRSGNVLWAAARPPSGGFDTARQVSAAGETAALAHVAMDREGNALATLSARVGVSDTFFKAASYDAAGPTLRLLGIPSQGTAGTPLKFTVSPFDVWSTVVTSWNFGDGATASGTAVERAYNAAGSFTVTVTGTDAFGNSTSAQGVVKVAPRPVPPVPDTDGDGFRDDQDCKPLNARIFPGAVDRPENGIDENCDGEDARYPRIDPPSIGWLFENKKTRFKVVRILFTDIPNGVKAHARCLGKGCTFKRTKSKKSRKHRLNLLPRLGRKVRFKPGQTLEVRATRRGYMGRVIRVKLKKGLVPKPKRLCLKPGTTKPRTCR